MCLTKESRLVWNECRKLIHPYGRFKRIESHIEGGVPDVSYTLLSPHGFQGWIELKIFDTIGRSPRHFTLNQLRWGEAETKVGGNWHLLGRCGSIWLLYDIEGAKKLHGGEGSFPILQSARGFPVREFLLKIVDRV